MEGAKLVVVGDSGVGKSCLFISYTHKTFPSDYIPKHVGDCSPTVMVDGKSVTLALWDTVEGQEDYDSMRPLVYPQTDIIFICFSVDNENSLENVEHKWIPEVRHHCPDVPVIVVACKIDLRSSRPMLTYEQGYNVAEKYGMKYCETSSLTQQGLTSCFDEAVRTHLNNRKKKKGVCCIV